MRKILVTGAQGQIGSELVPALRQRHGAEAVVATFHRKRPESDEGLVEHLDSTDARHQTHRQSQWRRNQQTLHGPRCPRRLRAIVPRPQSSPQVRL